MAFYYQEELDNLSDETIKELETYTEENFPDWVYYKAVGEFQSIDDIDGDGERVLFLENLGIDLGLDKFNLTDIQSIIVGYMFINDLFGRKYVDEVMEMLEEED